jgi:hypothetical protein
LEIGGVSVNLKILNLIYSTFSFALKTFWVCLFVSLFFVLVEISLKFGFSLKSSDVASWVQAIGSIVAIWGAFIIANRQSATQALQKRGDEQARHNRVIGVVLLLAQNQKEQLRLLHSTLLNARKDFGENTINPYLEKKWHLKWPAHIEILKSIDINELDAPQVKRLLEMKVGAKFAWSICERIPQWNVLGAEESEDLTMLNHYWETAGLMVAMLESSKKQSAQ